MPSVASTISHPIMHASSIIRVDLAHNFAHADAVTAFRFAAGVCFDLAMSRDGRYVASATLSGVRVFDLVAKAETQALADPHPRVRIAAIENDPRFNNFTKQFIIPWAKLRFATALGVHNIALYNVHEFIADFVSGLAKDQHEQNLPQYGAKYK